jgi:hypothetical protein
MQTAIQLTSDHIAELLRINSVSSIFSLATPVRDCSRFVGTKLDEPSYDSKKVTFVSVGSEW